MSEYNFDGIPDDNEFEGESQSQYDLSGIPDDDDSADVSISLQQKYNSANQNPDQIATAKRHAEKAGIPMLVAQNQPDKAAKLANAPDWTRLTKDAPITARTLSNDGTFFQIAHDDHETLGAIEQGLLTLGKAVPVVGQAVQAVDTTKKLIEGMTGISLMGDKDDVGTVVKKYAENWDNQARKTMLGLFMAADSAQAQFLAPNAGEGIDGWYYRQNKNELDGVVDEIAGLADSSDPIEQNRSLQLAQEYGFDSVPRTIGPGNVVNRRKLLDAVIDKRASADQANTNAGIIAKNKRRAVLVDMVKDEDKALQENAAQVDAYTVPWLVSNSMQFVDQMVQAFLTGGGGSIGLKLLLGAGKTAAERTAIKTTGSAFGQGAGFVAPVFGNEYATGKASGKTDDAAAIDAGASALIEGTTEMIGLKSIEDAAKGLLPILQGVGRATGTNFSQEQAAEIAGQVYDGFANDKHVEQPDYIKGLDAPEPVKQFLAILDQQLQAGVIGAAGGGAMAGTGAGVKAGVDKYKERKQAKLDEQVQQVREQIDTARTRSSQIIETIEKIRTSKLKARDTSSLKALIQSIGDAENDAPTAMLLSADAFKQGGIDPDVFKRAVPSAADQVDRAIELGGTIAIDIGELANITDSEVEQGLIPHLKVHEDEWTQYEAEAAELQSDEAMAEMQEAADTAAREAENQDEWTRQSDEIRTKYEEQLNKVGQYDKAANKKMAALVSAFYSTTASKLAKHDKSVTPAKLFNQSLMNVNGGAGSGQGFNHGAGDNNSVDGTDNRSRVESEAAQDGTGNDTVSETQSRIVQWANSVGLHGRTGISTVGRSYSEASRYKGEFSGKSNPFISADERITTAEEGRAEQERLISTAKENGFFLGFGHPFFESLEVYESHGGMEHDAYIVGDAPNKVVIRSTTKGEFGHANKHSPADYLKRIDNYNKLFPDLKIEMIGVHQDSDGSAQIWTAQKFAPGNPFKSDAELDAALRKKGWYQEGISAPGLPKRYKHKESGAIIADVHPDNILHDGDNLYPIDVIVEKLPDRLYQNESAPRGAFDPNKLNIYLLERADLSTFLHESGHFFLEMYARYADQSAEIGADMDALLKWFGVKGDDQAARLAAWRAMSVNEQRSMHEQFAESFEQYLFSGKAPSIELQPIFSTFRRWLTSVYQSLARFVSSHSGAKLNPEIAAVMDRMLATQDQIDEMTQARNSRPLFANADQAGMTQAQWDAYMQDQVRSVEQAADTLVARSLRDMKWLTNAKNKQLRKLQREAQALRAQVQMEARRAILSRPEYRAWLALKRPVEKLEKAKRKNSKELDASVDNLLAAIAKLGGLDMEEVVSSWGSDPADFNKKSGVFGKPVLRKKGGLSIETIAEKLLEEGYLTPDQHGKVDLAEFEEKLDRAARGEPMYSMFADYDLLLYGDEKRSASPRKEDIDYIGVRLNRGDLLEMYGRNNPEVKWHKPIAGMLLQPAYHGSPYRFDKFSLDHMGKGEGAQAYGWGLYFAGSKEVAEYYRQALAKDVEIVDGDGNVVDLRDTSFESLVFTFFSANHGDYAKTEAELSRLYDGEELQDFKRILQSFKVDGYKANPTSMGQLYKVEIPEDDTYLLWDKPLSEQPQAVKDALGKQLAVRISDTATGADIYSRMAGHFGGAATDGAKERASKRLHSLGINGIKYLDGSSRGKGEGNYNYVIFDDNAIEITETFYQPAKSANNANYDRWARGGEYVSGAESATKDFKTGEPVVLEGFHGTQRPDRVGVKFLKKRATSGPMAFFTNSPDLASSYATGKQDTSLADEDTDYKNWFKVAPPKGSRTKLDIERAWYFLDSETKKTIAERMKDIRLDDDAETVVYEEGGGDLGNYEWELKQARGNVLKAAVESWLMSGSIFGDEHKFMDVLRLAGFPVKTVEYDPPHAAYPFLYHVAIRMSNPLVTSDIPQSVRDALNDAAKKDRSRAGNRKADHWDKTTRTLREWVKEFNGGDDAPYVWTSIPDKVTDVFRSLGYDGIIDYSGKGGGDVHKVYIPFEENNVKSFIGNKGTFDESNNILKQEGEDGQDKGAVRNLEDMGMVSDDGLHPDVVAELFVLTSGEELVRKLLEMDDPITAIDKLTDKIMLERHSEFTDTKAMERMAEAAIHNEARVRFVATELAMLNKAQGGQKDLKRIIDAARLYAQDLLAGQRIQDIRPSKHAADAARAGKAAERAFAKGNIAETIMAKRNQVLHTELVRQANAAKDTVESGLKYFARIEKAVNNGVLDADYAQQIVGLLQAHDLRKSTSLIDLERRESLMAWVQAQQDAGFEPMIPEHLLLEAQKTHYKRMTLDEFNALVDAIKNIEHLGRLKYKLVQNARKRELAAAATEIGEAIADNATGEVPARLEKNSVKDRVFDLVNGFLYMHRKFASLIRQMDGWKDGGVLWDYFVKTMNDAGDREAVMREQATMAMADLMKPLHESGGFGMMPKKLFITQIGTSLTREGRLMVALNWGNEGNRQRLMDGEGWDVNQVNAVLATLNAEDWKFVQGVWDHLETYRPMVGEQQKRLSGVEPKWIEASPFMVAGKDGQTYELRGGYLPVKYDADRSTKSLTQEALSNIMDQHKAVRAKTRDSFTKGRAAKVVNRPLRKDFGVIFQHMTEVTHRLAWQDWLMDSKRLLAQPAVDEAVRKHYGPAMVTELQKTLDDIAIGEVGPANEFEAAINHLRTGATVAGLGLNFMTALMQPLGLTQSMVRIGPTWVMKGLAKWGRMEDALLWIYERSDLMRLRGKTASRELNEELNKIRSPKRAAFNELMFVLIQKGQIIADVLTWLGAYEKAIAEQGPNIDEKLAAKLADQAVLDAQSGGMQKDLARIQRGGSLQRLFTMFYSYFSSTYNLSVESVRKVNVKDPATIMSAAIDFLLLYSIPAAISTAISSALTGDDDEDEFWGKMARGQVSYFLSVMVGVREFGSVVNGFSGYSGPAGTRFFNEAAKLATQIGQGDMDAAMLKALNNVGGILFHYPAGQINKTIDGAVDLSDDKTDNPAALLFGSRK